VLQELAGGQGAPGLVAAAPAAARAQQEVTLPAYSGPPQKVAAPLDAAAIAGFKPIAGAPDGGRQKQPGAASSSGPWSVQLVAGGADVALVQAVAGELTRRGILVQSSLAARPDAVLALGRGEAGAWYCDSPAGIAAAWGAAAASAVPSAGGQSPPAGVTCPALQGGLARTPAAVLQVPEGSDPGPIAAALAESVARFFAVSGPAARSTRAASRLSWPADGPITSYFGPSHPLGIDIGQLSGPIRAASDGVVYFAGGDPCCSYGRFVVIDGPDGLRTLYAHLDSLSVKTGDRVKAGQVIGQEGCTGHCDGPHLHFEVIDHGLRQDPLAYLR
jgi:murein DD-endopeptidase MepM/ murein hydrolase activator NlpD